MTNETAWFLHCSGNLPAPDEELTLFALIHGSYKDQREISHDSEAPY